MANGTYNNPRAGSNGSKNRMKSLIEKVTPVVTDEVNDLSDVKKISERKFKRKLKRAKQGEVTINPFDRKNEISPTQTTTVHGKNKSFAMRENPSSDRNTIMYYNQYYFITQANL